MPDVGLQQWQPNLNPEVDPSVRKAIKVAYRYIYRLRGMTTDVSSAGYLTSAQADQLYSPEAMAASLSSSGESPLNVTGLLGTLAQPQIAGAPTVSALPAAGSPLAQDSALVWYGGSLYRYNASSGSWNVASGSGGGVPTTRLISTTLPLTGGGDLSADRTLAINNFSGDSGSGGTAGAVPAPAAGDAAAAKFLKADGSWQTPAGGGGGLPTAPEPANTVLAGPATGANAAPTFRALVAADIPGTLNPTTISSSIPTGFLMTVDAFGSNAEGIKITSGANSTLLSINIVDSVVWDIVTNNWNFGIDLTGVDQVLTIDRNSMVVALRHGATVPTAPVGDNSNTVADTAFVHAAIAAGGGGVPTSRLISTTAPLTGGGDLSADRTLAVSTLVGDTGSGGASGVAPAPAAGNAIDAKFLKADATWSVPPGVVYKPTGTLRVPDYASFSPANLLSIDPGVLIDVSQSATGNALVSVLGQDVTTPNSAQIVVSNLATLSGALQYWPITLNPAPIGLYRVSCYLVEVVAGGTNPLRINLTYFNAGSGSLALDIVPQVAGGTAGACLQSTYTFYHSSATAMIQITVLGPNTGNMIFGGVLERIA